MELVVTGSWAGRPAGTQMQATDVVTIPAGQRLRIETSPGGAEILDAEVPVGKVWTVQVSVSCTESDA